MSTIYNRISDIVLNGGLVSQGGDATFDQIVLTNGSAQITMTNVNGAGIATFETNPLQSGNEVFLLPQNGGTLATELLLNPGLVYSTSSLVPPTSIPNGVVGEVLTIGLSGQPAWSVAGVIPLAEGVVYSDGVSTLAINPTGAIGEVLQSTGAGLQPAWAAIPGVTPPSGPGAIYSTIGATFDANAPFTSIGHVLTVTGPTSLGFLPPASSGGSTFPSIILTSPVNQIQFGQTLNNTITISAATPAADRIVNLLDAGATSNFILSQSISGQTINNQLNVAPGGTGATQFTSQGIQMYTSNSVGIPSAPTAYLNTYIETGILSNYVYYSSTSNGNTPIVLIAQRNCSFVKIGRQVTMTLQGYGGNGDPGAPGFNLPANQYIMLGFGTQTALMPDEFKPDAYFNRDFSACAPIVFNNGNSTAVVPVIKSSGIAGNLVFTNIDGDAFGTNTNNIYWNTFSITYRSYV